MIWRSTGACPCDNETIYSTLLEYIVIRPHGNNRQYGVNIMNCKKSFLIFVLLSLLVSGTRADFGYDDSPEFYLNLLNFPTDGTYGYADSPEFYLNLLNLPAAGVYGRADSPSFNLNIYPVNRGWSDSEEISLNLENPYHISNIDVFAGVRYDNSEQKLYLTSYARDRASGTDITSGTVTYEISDMGVSGTLSYSMGAWQTEIDLSADPPMSGQHIVKVSIGNSYTTRHFTVIAAAGTVSGIVSDTASQYLAGADVYLFHSNDYFNNGSAIGHTTTNNFGQYSFGNLLPGWYIVSCQLSGYDHQFREAKVTTDTGAVVNLLLTTSQSNATLASLIPPMSQLKTRVLDTMDYESSVLSEVSGQAVSDLSASLDAWDVVSFIKNITNGLNSNTISDKAAREGMEYALKEVFLKATFEKLVDEKLVLLINQTATQLLPKNINSWRQWPISELENFDLWSDIETILTDSQNEFASNAPALITHPKFDYQNACAVIRSQKHQLTNVTDGEPIGLMSLADPSEGYYPLALPVGQQTWKMDHAVISLTGGINKVSTGIQAASGTVEVASSATGVGLGIGAVAGTICTGAKVTNEVSDWANTAMKFHGALTYAAGTRGWAHDLAVLPMSYTVTKYFIEKEAANPYYLSRDNYFSGQISLDLNTLSDHILVHTPFMPATFNAATVSVTNTSNVAADFHVVSHGWWDYELPGNVPVIGSFFGGVSNIKVPTTVSSPVKISLNPSSSQSISVPYMGYYLDPVNMFSPHWLKVDVYAGPFLVDTISHFYYIAGITPVMAMSTKQIHSAGTALAASYAPDNQPQALSEDGFASLMPKVTNMFNGTIDAAHPTVELQYTADPNSFSTSFKLIADQRSYIALQVYDTQGNLVGYKSAQGGKVTQFVGSYSGNGSGYQQVEIPKSAGNRYTVKAVLEGSEQPGPFNVQLFAFETPPRPAVLAVMTESITKTTPWKSIFNLNVAIGEGGRQQPLQDVSVTLSDLVGTDPNIALPIYTATTIDLGLIPAAASRPVSFELSVPYGIAVGSYTGQISVTSSNAGSVIIPVTIIVDDSHGDLTGDGTVDLEDFAVLSSQWLNSCSEPDWCNSSDINESQQVDMYDLATMAQTWLWRASWYKD